MSGEEMTMKRSWIRGGLILFILVLGLCFASGALADSLPEAATDLMPGVEATATITNSEMVYFRFVPSKTAAYVFYSSSPDQNPYVYLYSADENELTFIDSDSYGGSYNNFRIKRRLTEGVEYYFGVNVYSQEASIPVMLEEYTELYANPVGNTEILTDIGETAELEVQATSGKGTVAYQWVSVDENNLWTDIEGETGPTYAAVAEVGKKEYVCFVTDGVTTEEVYFRVIGNDHFTISAVGNTYVSVTPHENVTMKVKASSDSEVTYQWYKNWSEHGNSYTEKLAGANSDTYTAEDVTSYVTYYCTAKSVSREESIWFTLDVSAPIEIKADGETYRTVTLGGSAEMSVIATSAAETLTYQWYYSDDLTEGSVLIEGATEPTYTAENIQRQTYYSCIVRNVYGSSNSQDFSIGIEGDYSAYINGYSYITVAPGGSFSATVYAYNYNNDSDTFTYQWYGPVSSKKETAQPITGETESTLSIEDASATGYYLCRVTNTAGIEKNLWVNVYIESDLVINDFYTDTVYANVGEEVTISVDARSAAGPITYQWYTKDDYYSDFAFAQIIEGATAPEYSITNPLKNPLYFCCAVTDIYGNTEIVNRSICFNGHISAEAEGGNYCKYVTPGGNETFSVIATGDGELSYQWSARSLRDGVWGNYQEIDGATEASYTVENVQGNMELMCRVNSIYTDAYVYFYVYVDSQLNLSIVGEYNRLVKPNETATLEVSCNSENVSYQWYRYISDKYGHFAYVEISGATEATYTTDPITQRENYYCFVRDSYGSSTSCDFSVSVDNNLQATVYGTTDHYKELYITPNSEAIMKVSVTAENTDGIIYSWSRWTSEGWVEIDNASGETLTTTVTEPTQYRFYIQDIYGNSDEVNFYVRIENNLQATIYGTTEESGYFQVAVGEDAVMKVSATANNLEGITYRWIKQTGYNSSYGWGNYQELEEVTGDELTDKPTEYTCYQCNIQDIYGNTDCVYFYVGIDNHLQATVYGTTENYGYLQVPAGENAVMKVFATATNSEGITYRWIKRTGYNSSYGGWENYQELEEVTGDELTDAPTEYTDYECSIQDVYGNTNYVCFYVNIDNQLEATVYGKEDKSENRAVVFNTETTMKVSVTAENTDGIMYSWSRWIDGEGWQIIGSATGDSLTETITEPTQYRFFVRDLYGNTDEVEFYVRIENNLRATAYGTTERYGYIQVPAGENAVMKVSATATNSEGITYRWIKRTGYNSSYGSWENYLALEEVTGNELTDAPMDYTYYECVVQDVYGNTDYVHFYVRIDNKLEATVYGKEDKSENRKVDFNTATTMKVSVSAENTNGIIYSWSRWDDEEGWQVIGSATGDSLTETITKATNYRFVVQDSYGNVDEVDFYIGIENNLQATVAGKTSDNETIYAAIGEDVTMQVTATATNTTGIAYHWSKYIEGQGWQDLNAATGDTLTERITGSVQYRCNVADAYNNRADVWFYIRIENGLQIQAISPTEVSVKPGERTTLQAKATCNNGGVTYQWARDYQDTEGEWHYEEISNATDATYLTDAATVNTRYYCSAKDQYGTVESVTFRVNIDNELAVTRVGDSRKVADYNGSVEMEVSATCLAGNPSYQWYKWEKNGFNSWSSKAIRGATSATYRLENITSASRYSCWVSDLYGNQREMDFEVVIENYLTADSYSSNLKVTKGSTATLTASATCRTGADQLIYQWAEEAFDEWGNTILSAIPDATDSTFTTSPINDGYKHYVCRVTDIYENSMDLFYNIGVDNHLSAVADGGREVTVQPGQNATMKVIASCDDDSALSYQWWEYVEMSDGNWGNRRIDGATSDTFTVSNVERTAEYCCRVSDGYETPKDVYFTVRIDNGLQVVYPKYTLKVGYGEDAVFEVEATCLQGDLTYRWYFDGTEDSTVSGSTYTVRNVTHGHSANCYVTDMYGNETWCNFHVDIDNGLWMSIKSMKVNDTEVADPYEDVIFVPYGANVEIEVEGGCEHGEPVHGWYLDGQLVSDATNYTLTNLQKSTVLNYNVSDEFSNKNGMSWIFKIENGFTATPIGETFRQVEEGDEVELGVAVTKTNGDVTFEWLKDGKKLDDTGSSITFIADKTATYLCIATDQYGTTGYCQFIVNVGTGNLLIPDQTFTVTIQDGRGQNYFFTPAESGIYELSSTGSWNTYVYLYKQNGERLGQDDNSGEGSNFRLSAELTAGERYRYNVISGGVNASFNIRLTKIQENENYISAGTYVMQVGQTVRLPYGECTCTSDTPDTVQVSGMNLTALKAGNAKVTLAQNNRPFIVITIQVRTGSVMTMPSAITTIEAEAFANDSSVHFVTLGTNTNSVGYFAFANSGLWQIVVPSATTKLSVSSFQGINPTILCRQGSTAEEFAQQNGYKYMYID